MDDKIQIHFPEHYRGKSGKQLIQLIEGFSMGFTLGSALKNIVRAAHCGDTDVERDISQAVFLINYYRENPKIWARSPYQNCPQSLVEDWIKDFELKSKYLPNGNRNHKRALGSAFRFICHAVHCDKESVLVESFLGGYGAVGDLEGYLRTYQRYGNAEPLEEIQEQA